MTKTLEELFTLISTNHTEVKELHSSIKKEFVSFKTKIEQQVNGIAKHFNEQVTSIKTEMGGLSTSQTFLSDELTEQKDAIKEITNKSVELEKENTLLNGRVIQLENELKTETQNRNDLEQYGRRIMVEISGIPSTVNENCLEIINKIANQTGLINYSPEYVDVVHRLSSKPDSGIIVKFVSRTSRDNFYNARKHLKEKCASDFGFPGDNSKIYINESLTLANKTLYKLVRERCKTHKFEFSWTSNGQILVRRKKDSKAIRITNQNDLKKIL